MHPEAAMVVWIPVRAHPVSLLIYLQHLTHKGLRPCDVENSLPLHGRTWVLRKINQKLYFCPLTLCTLRCIFLPAELREHSSFLRLHPAHSPPVTSSCGEMYIIFVLISIMFARYALIPHLCSCKSALFCDAALPLVCKHISGISSLLNHNKVERLGPHISGCKWNS